MLDIPIDIAWRRVMPRKFNDIINLYRRMKNVFNTHPDVGNERLNMRVALLKIRKIRRDLTVPNHEQDEVYNIATEALNENN